MDSVTARSNTYVAYMLRLWQAGSREGMPVWRASLENPHTGERLVFGDVAGLFAFLSELLASAVDARTPLAPDAAFPVAAGQRVGPAVSGEDWVE
jgi:hypothetical protein